MAHTHTAREDLDPDRLPPLLTMAEAAAFLSCHERTIREYIATGALPGYRLGRTFRFKRDDVLALLKPVPTAMRVDVDD